MAALLFKQSIRNLFVVLMLSVCICIPAKANERAASNILPDSTLSPAFYDPILGDYISNGDTIIVGRSQKQLFVYYPVTNSFRGLQKISALTWIAGSQVISKKAYTTYIFKDLTLEIYQNNKLILTAHKTPLYKTEEITFKNSEGLRLAGTLFHPSKPSGKAIVLVHGSGPQDRNGTASGMRILADVLVRQGITVLSYDKQGIGSSEGNWEKLNFTSLAKDALSAIDYLKQRHELKITKIGLGGYSQAGWVIARAVQQRPDVSFVLNISAAGSGVTVADQNIYDVKTQMECSGKFSKLQVQQIYKQQNYFFDYLLHHKNGDALDAFTQTLKPDTTLKDWLYPITTEIDFNDKTQWFNALEVGFDPLPIWKSYNGPLLATLGEFDDSTPSAWVQRNLSGLKKTNIQIKLIKNSQHNGLATNSVCNAKMNGLDHIASDFYPTIITWIRQL